MEYDSAITVDFWERNPPDGKKVNPFTGRMEAKGFKTTCGADYESNRLAYCLCHNGDAHYSHFITITFQTDLTETDHRRFLKNFSKNLGGRLDALWIRELCKRGRIHYHLITTSTSPTKAIHKTIRDSLPHELKSVSRVEIEAVRNRKQVCDYITKRNVSGYRDVSLWDEGAGYWHRDKFNHKRRLFVKECRLNKHGTIGKFWQIPPAAIWKVHVEREQAIDEYCDRPDIRSQAMVIAKVIASEADYFHTLQTIKRCLAVQELNLADRMKRQVASINSPEAIEQWQKRVDEYNAKESARLENSFEDDLYPDLWDALEMQVVGEHVASSTWEYDGASTINTPTHDGSASKNNHSPHEDASEINHLPHGGSASKIGAPTHEGRGATLRERLDLHGTIENSG